jgi:CheY-like chemotaxis protein
MAICVGEQSHASPPIQIQYPDKPDSPWTSLALFNAAQEEVWRHGDDDRRLYLYSHMDALGAQALHPVRILVVDDSDINREVATRLLLAEGAVVDQAANGHDALALLQEHKASYDAVLMDIQMPFMDGMQATQKIRQDLGLTTLPIVALTAGVLASERERAISAGMTDFVSKPLDPVLLLSSLRHHIQQYRGQPLPLVPSKQRAKPVSPAWPALPGIDMAQVIAEFKFDQSGYQRLLNQMVSEFGTQSVNWLVPASPLASPNLMKARLHKLAGTAAVLGASDIAKLAKTTEHALRDTPSVDVSIELAAIFESMTELQDGLRAWIQDGTGPEPEAITSPRELDQHALHALSEALQHHRLDALGLFESLATPLRQVMPPDTYNQLEQAIQSLDFGQAWGLIQSVDLKPVTVG